MDDVQDEEAPESQETTTPHPLSQMTVMLSDGPSEGEESADRSMGHATSTSNTGSISFRSSQEEPSQVEAEFTIHDEPSQQTLDTMVCEIRRMKYVINRNMQHAVTLTQQTSQLVPPLRPNLVKEVSQISLSMSSLIDFENNLSSQDDDLLPIEEVDVVQVQRSKNEEDLRKELVLEVC